MGTVETAMQRPVFPRIDPSMKNWITAHSQATGISLVAIEKLWFRFQQLGESDGVLPGYQLTEIPSHNSSFAKYIVDGMPKNAEGDVTFQSFINCMNWLSTTTVDAKLRALYKSVNNGALWTHDTLVRLLSDLYPKESRDVITEAAESLMAVVDTEGKDAVSQDDFVQWMRMQDYNKVTRMLDLSILPADLQQLLANEDDSADLEVEMRPITEYPHTPEQPTNQQLRNIADRAAERDFNLFCNCLGYSLEEIQRISNKHRSREDDAIFEMLLKWRDNETGTSSELKDILRRSYLHVLVELLD